MLLFSSCFIRKPVKSPFFLSKDEKKHACDHIISTHFQIFIDITISKICNSPIYIMCKKPGSHFLLTHDHTAWLQLRGKLFCNFSISSTRFKPTQKKCAAHCLVSSGRPSSFKMLFTSHWPQIGGVMGC